MIDDFYLRAIWRLDVFDVEKPPPKMDMAEQA